MAAAKARDPQPAWNADCPAAISTAKLEAALKVSNQAAQYEGQMKDLEASRYPPPCGALSQSLSNFRVIDGLLQEAFTGLQTMLNKQVPFITRELDGSMESLTHLAEDLPTIKSQVADIHAIYDSGHQKAQDLVTDLTWLNTEFYKRWRLIIFTSSTPVSWRWKFLMRLFFAVSFVMSVWLAWIMIWGGYRAHRGGLVWGERLMS
ncbi:hypothetical protein B0H10DRAFT_2203386 [Mycena sp. CBHHK59/15]|nr:hypothetical protein B0H10DRAFT_2203386 [Mycena sp. CBHHK59/15]